MSGTIFFKCKECGGELFSEYGNKSNGDTITEFIIPKCRCNELSNILEKKSLDLEEVALKILPVLIRTQRGKVDNNGIVTDESIIRQAFGIAHTFLDISKEISEVKSIV